MIEGRARCAGPAARAFEQTAHALTAVVTGPALVSQVTTVPSRCHAPDHDLLLSAFDVRITDGDLVAEAGGSSRSFA